MKRIVPLYGVEAAATRADGRGRRNVGAAHHAADESEEASEGTTK